MYKNTLYEKYYFKTWSKICKWTTISFHNYKELNEKVGKWKCICDCGYEKFIRAANLVGKYTSMCKTCSNKINTQVNLKPDKGACKTKILIQIKRQASSRNLEMLLTDSEILEITSKNCFYCKKEPLIKQNLQMEILYYLMVLIELII